MTEYLTEIFQPQGLRTHSRLFGFRQHLKTKKTIYWSYKTEDKRVETFYNWGCYDVSKSRIHEVHEQALGYSAKVNPETCEIPFLEKDELQGRHKCEIKLQNCEPKKGEVYELLMDNSREIRYMLCRTGEDFIFDKVRRKYDFSMSYDEARVSRDIDPVITMAVRSFSAEFGLHFAELDILMYGDLPYIIDVNNVAGAGRLFANCDHPKLARELYIEQIKSL